jgi:mono/diheme cytochrome c family protein
MNMMAIMGRMRPPLKGTALALLVAPLVAPLAACGRDGPSVDVREPLGARVAGARRAALTGRAGRAAVVPPTASLPPAAYTAEQAARGAQVYQATCARCHPPGQLDGEAFAVGWNGARAWTLFATLRNTMPQDKPGSLSDAQYVDVIAYLLQRNRAPAGAVALSADSAALRGVRIAVTPAAAPAAAAP